MCLSSLFLCVCVGGNLMDSESLVAAACKTLMNNTGIYQLIVCCLSPRRSSHSLSSSLCTRYSGFNEKHLLELLIRHPLFSSHQTISPSPLYSDVALVQLCILKRSTFEDFAIFGIQKVRFCCATAKRMRWMRNTCVVSAEEECGYTALTLNLQCSTFYIHTLLFIFIH